MTLYNPSHERTSKLTSETTIGDDCIHNFTHAAIIIAYKISQRLMIVFITLHCAAIIIAYKISL